MKNVRNYPWEKRVTVNRGKTFRPRKEIYRIIMRIANGNKSPLNFSRKQSDQEGEGEIAHTHIPRACFSLSLHRSFHHKLQHRSRQVHAIESNRNNHRAFILLFEFKSEGCQALIFQINKLTLGNPPIGLAVKIVR